MNLLQVQDDLKNFSQDQLVKEMQQPSGTTPQFLVLSELNRRKRVKGDLEARQAQNQPTVAEEAVASAGVPQSGMMGMPEAMAPASADSEGIGSMMPKSMRSGGEVERYAEGGLLEGIAESVSRNQQMLDTVSQNIGKMNSNMPIQQPLAMPEPAVPFNPIMTDMRHRRPLNGFGGSPFNTGQGRIGQPLGFGGKGPQRPGRKTYGRPDSTMAGLGAFADIFNKKSPAVEPQAMAEGGVIRAQDGLPEETNYGDEFLEYIKGIPSAMYDTGNAALNFLSPRLEGMEPKPEDTGFESMLKGTGRNINLLADIPSGIYSGAKAITDPISNFFTQPGNLKEQEKEEEKDAKNIDQALNDATIKSTTESKTEEKDEVKPLTLEEELVKRQAGLDKDRNFDKYMALAQAGLGILASDKPTLAGAIGEGGMKGLDAFNAANKRYEEGLNDILNARVKLKSVKKSGLTQKDAISAINGIDANIARLEKGSETFQYDDAKMKEIRNKIAQLEFQKESLMPSAGYGRLSRNVSDSANTKS